MEKNICVFFFVIYNLKTSSLINILVSESLKVAAREKIESFFD